MYTGATGHKNPPPIMPKRSMRTQEGITIGLRKGAIAQEKVSHSLLVKHRKFRTRSKNENES